MFRNSFAACVPALAMIVSPSESAEAQTAPRLTPVVQSDAGTVFAEQDENNLYDVEVVGDTCVLTMTAKDASAVFMIAWRPEKPVIVQFTTPTPLFNEPEKQLFVGAIGREPLTFKPLSDGMSVRAEPYFQGFDALLQSLGLRGPTGASALTLKVGESFSGEPVLSMRYDPDILTRAEQARSACQSELTGQ